MSESENLDLSARDLMASWVSDLEKSPSRYLDHDPDTEKSNRKPSRRKEGYPGGDRGDRGGGGPRRDFGRGRDRGDQQGPRRGGFRDRDRGDRDRKGGGGYRDRDQNRDRDSDRYDQPRPVEPLPPVDATLAPAPSAVDALARHIRSTGRAYPMADVAKMILGGRDRYQIRFQLKNPGEASLFLCEADQSLWVSREEAIQHLLNSPALKRYYEVEEVAVEPPKGNFAVVAVCGLSGRILGPPNHHEYQRNLMRLYQERFSQMPLERYKSQIEMKRDEETIEKWKAQVSRTFRYRLRTAEEDTAEPGDPPAEADETPADEETAAAGEPGDAEVKSADPGDVAEPELEAAAPSEPEPAGGEAPAEESPGEPDIESGEPESPGEEPASEPEKAKPAAVYLVNREAVARHFREHFADTVIRSVSAATVPGDIPGKKLSRGLLNLLRNESEKQRRGFPLTLIQTMCGEFEKVGLRFFKRGKKTLYVSVARPRPIKNEESFTDRVRQIVAYVREHPRAKVIDLLNALVADDQKAEKGETYQEHHLTRAEHDVLADLKWLTMEGYLIEYPGTELMLGRDESQPDPASPPRKKVAARPEKKKAAAPARTPRSAVPPAAAEPPADAVEPPAEEKPDPESEVSAAPESEAEPPPQPEPQAKSASEAEPSVEAAGTDTPPASAEAEPSSPDQNEPLESGNAEPSAEAAGAKMEAVSEKADPSPPEQDQPGESETAEPAGDEAESGEKTE